MTIGDTVNGTINVTDDTKGKLAERQRLILRQLKATDQVNVTENVDMVFNLDDLNLGLYMDKALSVCYHLTRSDYAPASNAQPMVCNHIK